ncbi:LiaF transmembrane domain-containing protein [Methanosarcina sp.]|uniref:LiaF transmembrane domain-containing protein n=1 Tax=Methanosarcina sp. TaxID=2213 RepID=UPI002AB806D4|nr:LiaF domain-containing protein [Methanosarcina sp.]MDY9925629.1 LiaF-related protein [Methanosarcina sp.]
MAKISYQTIFGAIILIFGILLLFRTTGIYDTGQLLRYIPSLFVLLGIYALWKSGFSNIAGPIILITIFTTLQLLILDLISWETISRWWPALVILMGIGILVNRKGRPFPSRRGTETVDLLAILSGVDADSSSEYFRGGDITAIFGGVDLDLRGSKIKEPPARINVISMFGGIDVRVPEEWQIEMDVLPILGSAEDERPRNSVRKENSTGKPDLIVTGFAAFGGFSIKD